MICRSIIVVLVVIPRLMPASLSPPFAPAPVTIVLPALGVPAAVVSPLPSTAREVLPLLRDIELAGVLRMNRGGRAELLELELGLEGNGCTGCPRCLLGERTRPSWWSLMRLWSLAPEVVPPQIAFPLHLQVEGPSDQLRPGLHLFLHRLVEAYEPAAAGLVKSCHERMLLHVQLGEHELDEWPPSSRRGEGGDLHEVRRAWRGPVPRNDAGLGVDVLTFASIVDDP
jgi:hypothetical protein